MTDAELLSIWIRSLVVGGVIVVAAAALLIAILLAAKRILRLALAALGLVEKIKANTDSIWGLRATNETAAQLLAAAESIRDHGALVAGALEDKDRSTAAGGGQGA